MKTERHSSGSFLGWLICFPFRFVFGAPLMGENPTNSTFASDGTGWAAGHRGTFFQAEPYKWQLMAGWKVALWRDVPIAIVIGGWWGWVQAPVLTCAVAGLVLGLLFELAVRWHELSDHVEKVDALHESLAGALGWDSTVKARHWLHIPVNYKDEDAVIRCDLPVKLYVGDDESSPFQTSNSVRQQINSFVFQRLGLNGAEMTSTYHLAGANPHVEYAHMPKVPKRVTLSDIEEAIEKAGGSELVLGLGRGKSVITIDLDDDAPHIMQSVGSGGGKSVQIALMAAQVLAHDGRVLILDPKGTSHRWAIKHPNVLYCRSMLEIHEGLMGLGAEMARRQDAAREDEHAIDACPRVLVVVEERNALMEQLQPWWDEYREDWKLNYIAETGEKPAKDLPKKCPSISVLRTVSYMGREPRLHLLSAAQQATANTMGGGASRESYAARLMGRNTTVQTWNFLAPNLTPRATDRKGRFFLAMHGLTVVEFQGAVLSPKELKKLALKCFTDEAAQTAAELRPAALFYREPGITVGEVIAPSTPVPAVVPGVVVSEMSPVPVASTSGSDQGEQVETVPVESPVSRQNVMVSKRDSAENVIPFDRPVSLSDAVNQGIVTIGLQALKKAAQRPGFPPVVEKRGKTHCYKPSALRDWEQRRPIARPKPAPAAAPKAEEGSA
jgi:hypothetical protein